MKKCKRTGFGKWSLALCITGMLVSVVWSLPSPLLAKEQLDVTQDKDKTVYSIGSSDATRREDVEDRERAWDMLRHMPVIMDNRQNPSAPVQPAPAK
jgi:hypothetical protein